MIVPFNTMEKYIIIQGFANVYIKLVDIPLLDSYGACKINASYCFSRLPGFLDEDYTELLATDTYGSMYRLEISK